MQVVKVNNIISLIIVSNIICYPPFEILSLVVL